MNKILLIFLACLSISVCGLSQNITLSQDSILNFLCKNWEAKYVMMGAMKIDMKQGVPKMLYSFNRNSSFTYTSEGSKDKVQGKWKYDSDGKMIKLTTKYGNYSTVTSLTDTEMKMVLTVSDKAPKNISDMEVVFGVRKD